MLSGSNGANLNFPKALGIGDLDSARDSYLLGLINVSLEPCIITPKSMHRNIPYFIISTAAKRNLIFNIGGSLHRICIRRMLGCRSSQQLVWTTRRYIHIGEFLSLASDWERFCTDVAAVPGLPSVAGDWYGGESFDCADLCSGK